MAKESQPVVTQSTRKKNPGFVNPNKGIHVGEGMTMQDVPRDIIIAHMRETENYWKKRFNAQNGHTGAVQSFSQGF